MRNLQTELDENEYLVTVFQRHAQGLQAGDVARKLEYPAMVQYHFHSCVLCCMAAGGIYKCNYLLQIKP